jgi:hypothetical protein
MVIVQSGTTATDRGAAVADITRTLQDNTSVGTVEARSARSTSSGR